MLGRFGKDAGSLLGVEITPPFIRLVRLRHHRGRYRLEAWGLEPLPAAAMHNGWIGDPEQVGEAMLQAVGRWAGRVRQVAVALPAGRVIDRLVSMPAGFDDDAIAGQLATDAGQFMPFALDDAAIDFQVMGPDPDNLLQQQVVVCGCHLALLEVLQASLECAGLHACVVEPDNHALFRAVPGEGLLLQVESEAVVFHEQHDGLLPSRHEVPLVLQAERAQSLAGAVDNYLLSSPRKALPARLLLLGAGAQDLQLPLQLQQRLAIEVSHADPLKQLVMAPGLGSRPMTAQAACLAVACGLAMREGDRCLQ